MSLYGDLPQAKEGDGGGPNKGWTASASKLQPALRKSAAGFAPPAVLRAGGRGPGPAGRTLPAPGGRGGGRGPASGAAATAAAGTAAAAAGAAPPGSGGDGGAAGPSGGGGGPIVVSAMSFFSANGEPLVDEYDPSRPNDYEDVLRERDRVRREAEEEAERVKRQREADLEAERRKREHAEAVAKVLAMSRPREHSPPPGGAAVVKEESTAAVDLDERERRLKLSGEEAFAARARLSRRGPEPAAPAAPAPPPREASPPREGPKGMGLAQKLLERMGWREGEGLGRNRQGISTPLIAQKRGDHAAVIVNAPEPKARRDFGGDRDRGDRGERGDRGDWGERRDAGEAGHAEKRPRTGAVLGGRPSRVLVLRNMVGPGQVDEDLEEEVGMELSKYGQVMDVKIFEVLTKGFDPAEAVRIFVLFDKVDAAVKASIDLRGRFFGGKEVRVGFFDEDRFDKQDLAPSAGEFGEG